MGLWSDLNRRPVGDPPRDFLHLLVGHGDTALGPVDRRVRSADPGKTIFDAMDHDVAARRNAQFLGAFFVSFVGVGNAQRDVVVALPVLGLNGIVSLRVSLPCKAGCRTPGNKAAWTVQALAGHVSPCQKKHSGISLSPQTHPLLSFLFSYCQTVPLTTG